MQNNLEEQVVVVTGASSGIGLATAHAFAEQGAKVVMAGRRQESLERAAADLKDPGQILTVQADVTNEEEVRHLARRAIETFGGIDVWVNNAAVTAFGRFDETPSDVFRKVLETNFFGNVHGARAALHHFRERGSGILVNVASVVAEAPQPFTSAYVSSKYAIRGLSACLRMELELDGASEIHVCTVLPASVDTMLFHHGANYTGRAAKPIPPVYDPQAVASAILSLASKPKREVLIGGYAYYEAAYHTLLPGTYERQAASEVDQKHFADKPTAPTRGNLFEPDSGAPRMRGGWRQENGGSSAGRLTMAGLALAIPALGFVVWRQSRRRLIGSAR